MYCVPSSFGCECGAEHKVPSSSRVPVIVEIEKFLRAYDVTYVIVGSLELAVADPRTLQLFDENESLLPVFVNGDVVIYDNRCTIHSATWFDAEKVDRVMWRTTVWGNPGPYYDGEARSWEVA